MPARIFITSLIVTVLALPSGSALGHGPELSRRYLMKACAGVIHAGLTAGERRRVSHFARYRKITCSRARRIVRFVDENSDSGYPSGYRWGTPHGLESSYPLIFGHTLHSFYAAPDGGRDHTAVMIW